MGPIAIDPMLLENPPADPFEVVSDWYRAAEACAAIRYPQAATLATVAPDGAPDARVVLIHERSAQGCIFLTDLRSAKGRQLAAHPAAALVFYWGPLDVQVRIRGAVHRATAGTASRIFSLRPRRSQATAWASRQSAPRDDAGDLAARVKEVEARFQGCEALPCPPSWVAYRVRPREVELWRARERRLHDRLLYTRHGTGWRWQRLDP